MLPFSDYLLAIDRNPTSVYIQHEVQEYHLPEHSHEKGQFIYIEGGVAYIHLSDKMLVIPARHYVWIPKKQKHRIEMHNSANIFALYFSADDHSPEDIFFKKGGIYPINTLLLEMLRFVENCEGDIKPNSYLYNFLLGFKNILPEISKKALPIILPTTLNEKMIPILKVLTDEIYGTLTLQQLSHSTGYSERTLSRLFRSTLGISYLQYYKLTKIIKGIELILSNKNSLSEIAYMLGYTSLSSFSNTFFSVMNIRPSEFARNTKK